MIMLVQKVNEISMQMQALTDPDFISRYIDSLHLHLNLNNWLNDNDQNLMMEELP